MQLFVLLRQAQSCPKGFSDIAVLERSPETVKDGKAVP